VLKRTLFQLRFDGEHAGPVRDSIKECLQDAVKKRLAEQDGYASGRYVLAPRATIEPVIINVYEKD